MPRFYTSRHPVVRTVLRLVDGLLAGAKRLSLVPQRQQPSFRDPRRILICNQSHLGDAILATAVLPALQRAFPAAEFGVLVHPAAVAVFDGQPRVHRIHVVEHWLLNRRDESASRKAWRHWQSRRRALKSIRAAAYDLALDLYHYFPNSIPLLRASGIPWCAGWTSGGFGPLLDLPVEDTGLPMYILDRHARLLQAIGLDLGHPPTLGRPSLRVPPDAAERWVALARQHGLDQGFIALHVGAHAAIRRWPTVHWQALARSLQLAGYVVVLLGLGSADDAVTSDVAAACPDAINLSGKLDWRELLAAIAACDLLVSHDSAATHIGAAFDKPRICLAAGINDLRVWLRATPRSVVLMQPVPCAPCFRSQGCASMDCIRGLGPEEVVRAVAQALAGSPSPRPRHPR